VKIGPFRILCGVGLVAWVAWMVSAQVDYDKSRQDGDLAAAAASAERVAGTELATAQSEPVGEDWGPGEQQAASDWGVNP